MTVVANPKMTELLGQLTSDPAYSKVAKIPLVNVRDLMLIGVCYLAFGCSLYAYHQHWFGAPPWLGFPIAWLVCAFSLFGVYTPLHDSTHKSASSNLLFNDVMGTASTVVLMSGLNVPAYRALHLQHHRYTGDKRKDPDEGLVSLCKGPLGFLPLAFVDVLWFRWYFAYAHHHWPRRHKVAFWLGAATVFSVYIIGFASPYAYEFLMLYVIPQRMGLMLTAYLFATIQHVDEIQADDYPLQATVRLLTNGLTRPLMLGQDNHDIHHMLPNVPWFKMHQVRELANGVLTRQNIPQRTIFTPARNLTLETPSDGELLQVVVTEVNAVAKGVKQLTVATCDGSLLPGFSAGSHIQLRLPSTRLRQYSLIDWDGDSSAPARHYRIAVKHIVDGRGGSGEIHQLKPGAQIAISSPRNDFVLYENAEYYALVSAGIGLTPLLSMAARLHGMGKAFELHICARKQEDIAFNSTLESLPFASSVRLHLSQSNGRFNASAELPAPTANSVLYACGPDGFMSDVKTAALEQGWDERRIRTESFGRQTAASTDNKPFEVTLARSDKTLKVKAEDNLLDVLHTSGVDVPFACMQGSCGTCAVDIAQGDADHRDCFLPEEDKRAQKRMCVCVSRAAGDRLTLDL